MASEQIDYPRDGATTLDLRLHVGIGGLDVRAGTSGGALLEGSADIPEHFRLEQRIERRDSRARIVIDVDAESKLRRNMHEAPVVRLALTPDLPISLVVDAGIGESELDLTGLRIANLEVKAGIGECDVRLPREGVFRAEIRAGIGQLTVGIPVGLAASIKASRMLGALDIDERFVKRGDRWVSDGYETAANRAEIMLKTSIGEVRVESRGWE